MGVKTDLSAYIKPKLPPPINDFYNLIKLFSRSKYIENELKKYDYRHTNETFSGNQ